MTRKTAGIVYLVGAGPGDPKLITVKGLEALRRADVVIYDHLVSPRLLDSCHPTATVIYVGKEKDRPRQASPGLGRGRDVAPREAWYNRSHGLASGAPHAKSQAAINRLLVRYAKAGRCVVRLKGGDPVLFGRGGEEALALVRAKIPYEFVPGVTSAIAVPAYAGIPVTHRALASSIAILTGHEDPSKSQTAIRWDRVATATDTLVLLMGVGTLKDTASQLIRHGRSKDTPCAVIEWGTLPRQRTVVGTLMTIARRCEQARLKAPAVVVVGKVVTLRHWLNWFEQQPLFGKRIVVTRPSDRAESLAELLEQLGAEVVKLPAIELAPAKANGVFHRAIQSFETFDWVFFTSPEGIHWFQRLLEAQRKDLRILYGRHIGAIGPKTAASIQHLGIHVDFLPKTFSQEGMLGGLKGRKLSGKRALILSAQDSRDVLEHGLRRLGMDVTRVAMYRTAASPTLLKRVQAVFREPIDWVTVTSSSCVEQFAQAMRAGGLSKILRRVQFVSIGPVTSATVRQVGGRVTIEAKRSTIEDLVEALVAKALSTGRVTTYGG